MPPADLEIDIGLVRRLLASQHPDLATLPLRLVANGWDNAVFRLGDALAVRIPRRSVAAHLIRHEQELIPRLAPRLPVAAPIPVRVGAPSPDFPWPWSVVPWLDGEVAADLDVRDDSDLAVMLAQVVRALQFPASPDAPHNPYRGGPLATRAEAVAQRLAGGRIPRSADVRVMWEEALGAAPWQGPPLWLHGDLHPANLLLREGRLVAVIDFGDVTAGDPATDLATAWLTFGPWARRIFRDLLDMDEATWLRARGWAVNIGTAMVDTAEPGSRIHRVGWHALSELLRGKQ
jgi:aminoglycoside phosphotransferase (APT) family kinase protein